MNQTERALVGMVAELVAGAVQEKASHVIAETYG
jgi:hypothetical protein